MYLWCFPVQGCVFACSIFDIHSLIRYLAIDIKEPRLCSKLMYSVNKSEQWLIIGLIFLLFLLPLKLTIMTHDENEINLGKYCSYCNCEIELVSDKEIYGSSSKYGGMYYRCVKNNDHYVGTYSDNTTSLGRVANKTLRSLKMQGHRSFNPLWKGKSKFFKSRSKAYTWLAKKIDISITHFGMFTEEQCEEVAKCCYKLRASKFRWFFI